MAESTLSRDNAYNMFQAAHKATTSAEEPPKQKHVRTCILFVEQAKSSAVFWRALKVRSFLSDEIQTFKALVLMHKVICFCKENSLRECVLERDWIRNLPQMLASIACGYRPLIAAYSEFLSRKLDFHKTWPTFNGIFDYDEYVSMNRTQNPNEGYEAVVDLLVYADSLHCLQRVILSSCLGTSSTSSLSCRYSAIIPVVQESYGIYQFVSSMLRSMHTTVVATDALSHLRRVYSEFYNRLAQFYEDCRKIRFITSIITVPTLSPISAVLTEEPSLNSTQGSERTSYQQPQQQKQTQLQPQPQQQRDLLLQEQEPPSVTNSVDNLTAEFESAFGNTFAVANQHATTNIVTTTTIATQNSFGQQQLQQQQAHYEKLVNDQQQLQLLQQQYQAMIAERNAHVGSLQEQMAIAHAQLEACRHQIHQLQESLNLASNQTRQNQSCVEHLKEISELRDRSEKLAKLYSALRSDHLAALYKIKTLEGELQSRIQQDKKGVDDAKLQSINAQHAEQLRLREEECAVLQVGLDKSLVTLHNLQQQLNDLRSSQLNAEAATAEAAAVAQKNTSNLALDVLLDSCACQVKHAAEELELAFSSMAASASCSVENAVAVLDSAVASANNLAAAVLDLLTEGESDRDVPQSLPQVVDRVVALCHSTMGVLTRVHGVTSGVDAPSAESLIVAGSRVAHAVADEFNGLKSTTIATLPHADRRSHASELHRATCNSFSALSALFESFSLRSPICDQANSPFGRDDKMQSPLDAEPDGELQNTLEVINKASSALASTLLQAERKQGLMQATSAADAPTLNVHKCIVESAINLVKCAGDLITCSAKCQQEIVAADGGQASPKAFYRKNHRWTHGLVSAARAVAAVSNLLVEAADGLVGGTRTLEECVVAGQQVSAATVQLLVASRVKALPNSKKQADLEVAAQKVTKATRSLVQLASEAAEKRDGGTDAKKVNDFMSGTTMSVQEFRRREMEQQVHILTLEKQLTLARRGLMQLRRVGNQTDALD